MRKQRNNTLHKATTQRLVRIALRRWGSTMAWNSIAELQRRGSPQMLALATVVSKGTGWRHRSLGMYILSQLRWANRHKGEYAVEASQQVLLAGLRDPHPQVIAAAVSGLGHRPHSAALDQLVGLAAHPDDDVRLNVAAALGHYAEPAAIDTLLQLAGDRDDEVRDWATFSLGTMGDADTALLRAVLWRNLADPHGGVSGEALVGLAARGDRRVIPHLLEHLTPDCRVYELEAAKSLADPALLDALLALEAAASGSGEDGYWSGRLKDAIAACRAPAG